MNALRVKTLAKGLGVGGLCAAMAVISSNSTAQETSDRERDRFKLSVGSYVVSRADSVISLNERQVGVGVSINPHDSLGTDLKQLVFRLDGAYRFNQTSSIKFSWYKISNKGTNEVDTDFSWVNDEGEEFVIEAGSELTSELSYEIAKINYTWSFYNSNKVELFTSAGFHITRFGIDVDVTTSVTGSSDDTSARDVDSTIPLPALGLGIVYHINPQWKWYLMSEFFALDYDDWRGTYSDTLFGIEYMPWKHFGLGIGIGTNNLNVLELNDEYRFSYDNRITGINLQLSTQF